MAQPLARLSPLREVYSDRMLTPGELRKQILQRAFVLEKQGVRAGVRVVIAHGNSIAFFRDLLALWTLRAIAVPVHPTLTAPERDEIVALTQAQLVLTSPEFSLNGDELPSPSWPSAEEECLVLFSSGSSGRPKGICHSWGALEFRLGEIQRKLSDKGQIPQRSLCFLPTSFGHGLIANGLAPLLGGSELSLLPDFNPMTAAELGQILKDGRIGFFSSVPLVWKILERSSRPMDLPDLSLVHCASAPLNLKTYEFLRNWCGSARMRNVYGLTECCSWIAGSDSPSRLPHEGYIGETWGAEIAIAKDGDWLKRGGDEGEIWLKTRSLLQTYIGGEKPELKNGFFRTGDVGYVDERGHLTLSGRLSEEINKGGTKISPLEIRQCLESYPSVQQAWVTALPDDLWGQTIGAMIVPENFSGFNLEALQRWSQARLAPHKQASVWSVVKELPRLPNGKVDGKKIVEILGRPTGQ